MDALGVVGLIAGLVWLTRTTPAEGLIRELDRKRDLPSEQLAAHDRLLAWIAALSGWPGAALTGVSGMVILKGLRIEMDNDPELSI